MAKELVLLDHDGGGIDDYLSTMLLMTMVRLLREVSELVTLLVTGPMTTVATALDLAPDIESKIKEIIWMGGALNVPGNVERSLEAGHDGSAEWNVYWDPIAAERVWQTTIPIVLCPLDLTNTVPVTSEFVRWRAGSGDS